jgi:hypothetical protein
MVRIHFPPAASHQRTPVRTLRRRVQLATARVPLFNTFPDSDANRVTVEARDGKVILKGNVQAEAERCRGVSGRPGGAAHR